MTSIDEAVAHVVQGVLGGSVLDAEHFSRASIVSLKLAAPVLGRSRSRSVEHREELDEAVLGFRSRHWVAHGTVLLREHFTDFTEPE